ncbi:MAG: 3-keto-5-aminohexanoate cleavage protein, partial [Acidimicrobiales bacterium]|nr:3-keto-5-aminohexanoate cleavage protein [Acidimicrobiales bacterium]
MQPSARGAGGRNAAVRSRPMARGPVIIEVAINGSTSKEQNPHVPEGPGEIAADALACFDAGAAI